MLTHGKAAESDLLNKERIDRLIEFAVGTDDVDSHIMHLHGRACDWNSMIVTQHDYDRLYRRNDLNRLPLEFARRLMMGGNPILFVGLGMTEEDLNREFRDFISNNPYHRTAPTFLLWSALPGALNEEEIALKRLDMLSRLGVLTIFDTDLPRTDVAKQLQSSAKQARAAKSDPKRRTFLTRLEGLRTLALSLTALGEALQRRTREEHTGVAHQWRDPVSFSTHNREDGLLLKVLWTRSSSADSRTDPPPKVLQDAADGTRKVCVLGSSGCGKGHAALGLARTLAADHHCLLVNGGFSFDTDSLLSGVAKYMQTFLEIAKGDHQSRSDYFQSLRLTQRRTTLHIVLNGAERFFSTNGHPLSAELDELLRLDLPGVHWWLFGTERIRTYTVGELEMTPFEFSSLYRRSDGEDSIVPLRQMDCVARQVPKTERRKLSAGDWRVLQREVDIFRSRSPQRISADSQNLRRAFYSWALDNNVLAMLRREGETPASPDDVKLAQDMLRALAFFGIPVEADVLASVAILRRRADRIESLLDRLIAAHLVLSLGGYMAYVSPGQNPPPRFALHRSLLTELRARFGIPLSEAKLSTSFNMSLYVAQPIDGYIPEPDLHDELGTMVDRLLGTYRDQDPVGGSAEDLGSIADDLGVDAEALRSALSRAGDDAQHNAGTEDDEERLRIHRLCLPKSVQRLRAALALLRGFYSTTGILTLDIGDRLIQSDRDGILQEHAERLDRLIDAYAKMSLARHSLKGELDRERPGAFEAVYHRGEPFYADDLVWLHNERGVVRLAMGDLYEARASFDRAQKVNREHVEYDSRGHNWRRIRVNLLTVEIEMGDIDLTRRMANEVKAVSAKTGEGEKRLREDELATAIADGFLAWCQHLQGEADAADELYEKAGRELRRLEETRAQTFFERLRVDARRPLNLDGEPSPQPRSQIEKTISLAQSTRQMDLVYRLKIALASAYFFGTGEPARTDRVADQQRALRLLEEALQYGLQTDVHRVRCEASMMIARIRHETGDYEGALRFASDALMVATRYGLELRKIMLRVDIARTMAARGHPVTAQKLALMAIAVASRQRYQTAIDRGERVLLDIPSISAAIGSSDSSGRRYY